ncbi:TPA: hypothetical protein ACTW9S_004161 [Raoultella planticola]|nr:hypothetical protein [Klebsiella variicola]HDX9094995.1 hypothetical protein [Klebsiella michiganensis]
MLIIGIVVFFLNILFRGFMLPAEYSLGTDHYRTDYARIFFKPVNIAIYWFIERASRWGGTFLIVFSIVGFPHGLMMFLGAGLLTGLIACILSPALSMLLAIKIHPYFKKTLKDANNTK